MPRLALLALLLATPATAADRPLKVPAGFTVTRVAGPPLVNFPVAADFDDRGRLYVTDMAGPITREEVAARKPAHRIVRLEDTDGDGAFDKATTFADGLPFPEGVMWLAGSVYTAAPPHIWKLTDTDGDGKADKREIWFDGKTLTGCANDLHGPYPGPDGYVYWAKGAFAKQEYSLPNGRKFTTRAAHLFRAKPDGTAIEPVMTGGMDNPVDVVFTPGGERIFSTTFFQHPAAGRRDGLVHAVYGGVYGKDHDVVRDPDHKWTSPHLMPVLTHLGPAAPCGLHRYEGDHLGRDYRDNLFCCQFNLRTVSRHVLVPKGATFETKDSPFVTSDDVDFHPTDVLEDADGSLLVIDTGGWYKLCCPSSQLVKADVTGGIYRVRKTAGPVPDDPRGLTWEQELKEDGQLTPRGIALALNDDAAQNRTPAAFRRLADRLAAHPDPKAVARAFDYVAGNSRGIHRRFGLTAVAVLARLDHPEARRVNRDHYMTRPDPDLADVTLAAIHAAGLWRDKAAADRLVTHLKLSSLPHRRAAAEALGRIGDPKAVPDLLTALADEANDRAADHSLAYALIEIADPKATAAGLAHKSPRVQRAALAALDQMPGGKLDPKDVLPHLSAADPALKETAWWIAGRRPEWGGLLTDHFRGRLKEAGGDDLPGLLARFAASPAVQAVIADAARAEASAAVGFRAMARAGLKATPAAWLAAISAGLGSPDPAVAAEAVAAARAVAPAKAPPKEYAAALLAAARRDGLPHPVRLAALAAAGGPAPDDALFAYVLARLGKDEPAALRSAAADVLTRAALTPAQLAKLTAALPAAGPLELPRLLDAFARSKDEAVGLALVKALDAPAVRPALRTDAIKPILDKYPPTVRDAAAKLYAELDKARAGEKERLEAIMKELPAGNVNRGQVVFNSAKAACAACHKIGYVGGTVGPDLTRIGALRTERDLLDSVLFPSAAFVRGYEPVKVSTTDGRDYTGVVRTGAPDEVVLAVAADKEVRIPRSEVEAIKPGTVSVMPAGLDQQLTRQELADLLAFLKACK